MKFKKLLLVAAAIASLGCSFLTSNSAQASINSEAKKLKYSGTTYLYNMLAQEGIKYNKFYSQNKILYRNGKPEGIVIHETADPGATAQNEAIYFNREWMNMYAYVHAFVDHTGTIQMMTPNYGVWGAGPVANNRFVQVELCEENNREDFIRGVNNDAIYAASILRRYLLKPNDAAYDGKGTVWSHHAVSRFLGGTDHTDPDGYFAKFGYRFSQFYQLVKYYYNKDDSGNNPGKKDNSHTTQPPKKRTRTVMHNAYVYNDQHQRVGKKIYRIGDKVTILDSKTIDGRLFAQIGKNQYLDAANITGAEKTLTRNSYIYDKRGKRSGHTTLKAGQNVTAFGAPVKIKHQRYQIVGLNQYIKAVNFQ